MGICIHESGAVCQMGASPSLFVIITKATWRYFPIIMLTPVRYNCPRNLCL